MVRGDLTAVAAVVVGVDVDAVAVGVGVIARDQKRMKEKSIDDVLHMKRLAGRGNKDRTRRRKES